MTQETIVQAMTILATTVSTIVLAWMNKRTKKVVDHTKAVVEASAEKTIVAESKVREVKHALANSTQHRDLKLQEIEEVQHDIRRLLNGERLQMLETNRDLATRIAKLTDKPEDQLMATFADRRYQEHKRTLEKYYTPTH